MKIRQFTSCNLKNSARLILLLSLFFMAGYGTMAALIQLFGS